MLEILWYNTTMATLKELREKRALTQDELSRLSGIRAATISSLETSLQKPRPSTHRKLAKALKVKPIELEF